LVIFKKTCPRVCGYASTGWPVHKYVDDITLSELLQVQRKQHESHISTELMDLLTWTADNGMELNNSKTKEMVIGA